MRQVGGGRIKEERGRREGGGETGVRIKVGVMELEGRKLGGLEEGSKVGGREGMKEGVGMRKGGTEGWRDEER